MILNSIFPHNIQRFSPRRNYCERSLARLRRPRAHGHLDGVMAGLRQQFPERATDPGIAITHRIPGAGTGRQQLAVQEHIDAIVKRNIVDMQTQYGPLQQRPVCSSRAVTK